MKEKYIDRYGIDSLPQLIEFAQFTIDCDDFGGRNNDERAVFITSNQSMIEDREELEHEFGVKIRTPEEFVGGD